MVGFLEDGNEGKWNSKECRELMRPICQVYMMETFHLTPTDDWPSVGDCKEGWMKFGKGCFKLVHIAKKWTDANEYCAGEAKDGSLAVMTIPQYNMFLTAMLKNFGSEVWIGLNTPSKDWIFHWTTNKRLTYTNWGPGMPVVSDWIDSHETSASEVKMAWNDHSTSCKALIYFNHNLIVL